MKKIILLIITVCILLLSACGNNNNELDWTSGGFKSKATVLEKDDGWVEYLEISDSQNSERVFNFGEYNLKNKNDKSYQILTYDEEGNVIDKTMPSLPYIDLDPEYGEEIENINNFFKEKNFTKAITVEDLKELNLKKYSKKHLVELYNETNSKEYLVDPQNGYLPEADIEREIKKKDGYKWQIGYIGFAGNILMVKIDIFYGKGKYLTDLIKQNETSKEQQILYEKIMQIENYIIESQSFNIGEYLKEGDEDFERLYDLSMKIENLK